jgi:hypothetical protein
MGLGFLIHFVWEFLSYILYGDFFHSWSSKGTLSTPLIEPLSPSLHLLKMNSQIEFFKCNKY